MTGEITITGGASPEIAAAVAAVVGHLLESETRARATPPTRHRQHQWVLAGRPRSAAAPLPSQTYDSPGWSETTENGEESTK